jgi:hypothetical protein
MLKPRPGPEVITHIPDAVWLLGLWLAVHGGDPGPELKEMSQEQTNKAMNDMMAAIQAGPRATAPSAHVDQLKKLGVTVHQGSSGVTADRLCFSIGSGSTTCIRPPALK